MISIFRNMCYIGREKIWNNGKVEIYNNITRRLEDQIVEQIK